MTGQIRPLRRGGGPGSWRSRDGRWTFLRHLSDPQPQRWFAYADDDDQPANEGLGHVTLADVADWAERQTLDDPVPDTARSITL